MAAAPVGLWLGCWLDECRLRYWLSNGDVDTAVHWAKLSGLTADGELSYHHDLHHINLARVLIAQGRREPSKPYLDEAQSLLTRLLAAAEEAGWVHETIKILVLQAMAWQAAGEMEGGTAVLTHALTLAEPGGYIRLFIDEGESMRQLLRQIERSDYARRLLAEMGDGAVAPPSKLKCFLCIHLGKTLVQAGSRLQARYAPQSSALTPHRIANPEIRMQSR